MTIHLLLQLSSDASTESGSLQAGVRIGDVYALLVGGFLAHDSGLHLLVQHTLC